MVFKLKKFLWRLTDSDKCPYCKKHLHLSGFKPHYFCPNPYCEFNK